jgi:hypothetical protein
MDRLNAQSEELAETVPADELLTQYFRAQGWLKSDKSLDDVASEQAALDEWAPKIDEKWE